MMVVCICIRCTYILYVCKNEHTSNNNTADVNYLEFFLALPSTFTCIYVQIMLTLLSLRVFCRKVRASENTR